MARSESVSDINSELMGGITPLRTRSSFGKVDPDLVVSPKPFGLGKLTTSQISSFSSIYFVVIMIF